VQACAFTETAVALAEKAGNAQIAGTMRDNCDSVRYTHTSKIVSEGNGKRGAEAQQLYDAAWEIGAAIREPYRRATTERVCLHNLAKAKHEQGWYHEAAALARRCLALCKSTEGAPALDKTCAEQIMAACKQNYALTLQMVKHCLTITEADYPTLTDEEKQKLQQDYVCTVTPDPEHGTRYQYAPKTVLEATNKSLLWVAIKDEGCNFKDGAHWDIEGKTVPRAARTVPGPTPHISPPEGTKQRPNTAKRGQAKPNTCRREN